MLSQCFGETDYVLHTRTKSIQWVAGYISCFVGIQWNEVELRNGPDQELAKESRRRLNTDELTQIIRLAGLEYIYDETLEARNLMCDSVCSGPEAFR
ncbi:MAG: hypothetical protein A49_11760 [Methyloceanibacter sp.]|nr:MAG: hypothetical protein A49_11760 [Methyloceanibacter sp.]